jgi:hypothetical protein
MITESAPFESRCSSACDELSVRWRRRARPTATTRRYEVVVRQLSGLTRDGHDIRAAPGSVLAVSGGRRTTVE